MISSLIQILANFRLADFIDIAFVSVFLYFVFMWLRRKASRSLVVGVIAVVTLYALARILNMYMISQVFQAGLTAALVGIVIIFQDDIRMAVERLAYFGTFHSKHHLVASNKTVECLVDALCNLARDRIGALVAIKGRESIDRHLSGGISVNGRISVPLLYSIFHPETPSHDGAVIIEGERIEKFAVRLPLSHNISEVGDRGTRHTAALGLAERSDALVIVVSEERGIVSIAQDGHLVKVDKETLRLRIDDFYSIIFPSPSKQPKVSSLTQNAGIKAIALVSAIALWLTFAYRVDMISRTFSIPVEYRNAPVNWVIEDPKPTEISVSLNGPERSFNFDMQNLVASFDVSHLKEGFQTLPITKSNFNTPSGLEINQISSKLFTFRASKIEEVDIPVKVRTTGKLASGLQLTDTKYQPQIIRLQIPSDKKASITEVVTEPIELERLQGSETFKARLNLPSGIQLLDASQEFIKVTLLISQKGPGK
jgi:diadenylate cyclase